MQFDIENYTNQLLLNNQGFYSSKSINKVSYPEEGSDLCFAIEDSSFWFNHRKKCILEVVRNFPPENNGYIFDIGGGNGFMTLAFQKSGYPSILVEPSLNGILNANQHRGLDHCIHSSLEKTHFFNNSISAASAFDVIEHIEDDMAFMQIIFKALKKRGRFYLTVPAYNWLWSSSDDLGGHFRRYTCHSMCKKLEKIGFQINYATYIFQFLVPVIFGFKTLPDKLVKRKKNLSVEQNKKEHEVQSIKKLQMLNFFLSRELKKVKRQEKLAFGASCLIGCSK